MIKISALPTPNSPKKKNEIKIQKKIWIKKYPQKNLNLCEIGQMCMTIPPHSAVDNNFNL